MLLINVYIVYQNVFVGGAVVFDRVGQLSEFAGWNYFVVSFINTLLNKFSRVTVEVLECWAYSPNSKSLTVGNTFL